MHLSVTTRAKTATSKHSKGASLKADPVCGIVMPISAIDNCSEVHWAEVLDIITEAVGAAGFQANIVSNADEVGIIQKRIIQNLYDNPIVVCDVSGKNPNVMFELGVRLAFDKPTIIIKDDQTNYSFDTAPIEHLEYPRDLRFNKIVDFKKKLGDKVAATVRASQSSPSYTTFLKHFGEFKVAQIDHKEVSQQEFLIEELSDLKRQLRRLDTSIRRGGSPPTAKALSGRIEICLAEFEESEVNELADIVSAYPGTTSTSVAKFEDHFHLLVRIDDSLPGLFEWTEERIHHLVAEKRQGSTRARRPSKQ